MSSSLEDQGTERRNIEKVEELRIKVDGKYDSRNPR